MGGDFVVGAVAGEEGDIERWYRGVGRGRSRVGEDRDGRGRTPPRRAEGGVREGELGDLGEAGEVGEAGAAYDGDVEGSCGREGLVMGII